MIPITLLDFCVREQVCTNIKRARFFKGLSKRMKCKLLFADENIVKPSLDLEGNYVFRARLGWIPGASPGIRDSG